MAKLPRTISPALNPTGWIAAAGVIYAGVSMAYNAANHHGAWSTPVFVALVGAVASLLTRQVVTPVADPVDGAGRPLVPAPVSASGGILPSGPGDAVPLLPPGHAGPVHVVPPQVIGTSQVITEPGELPPP